MTFEAVKIQDISGAQMIKVPENFKINDDKVYLKDDKVYLKKVGDTLYIIPFHNPWQSMVDSVNEFSEDFMIGRQQPNQQFRDSFD